MALGLALKAQGYAPLVGVPASLVDKVKCAGLDAFAIMPAFDDLWAELGMNQAQAVTRIMADQDFMISEIALRVLAEGAAALDAVAHGAEAIIGSYFALAAPIIAEKRGIPYVPAILQPMTILSAYDPPIGQGYGTIGLARKGPVGRRWNRLCFAVIRRVIRHRYGGTINKVRAAHGLGPQISTPILDLESNHPLRIALYSSIIAPTQPDFPVNIQHVGFPVFDSGSGAEETLDPELEAFLAAGDPLVFTLGSMVTSAPGDFFSASAAAARALGRRAVLLTGNDELSSTDDVLVRAYAPHSLIFPRAAAIIHHGGIGTTGAALRAGRPQLVVPHMGDQWDNGARVARLGAGSVLGSKRYTAARATQKLRAITTKPCFAHRAAAVADEIAQENGAVTAASAIAALLGRLPPGVHNPITAAAIGQ
jgi:rhamnosyltransferase subunit B